MHTPRPRLTHRRVPGGVPSFATRTHLYLRNPPRPRRGGHTLRWLAALAITAISSAACSSNGCQRASGDVSSVEQGSDEHSDETGASQPTHAPPAESSRDEQGWAELANAWGDRLPTRGAVEARIAAVDAHLASSDGGQVLHSALVAHGGLQRWYTRGALDFTIDVVPTQAPAARRHTRVTTDLWSRRTYQHLVDEPSRRFGWDGEVAWIARDAGSFGFPIGPWATIPFVFAALPFSLADAGVVITQVDDREIDGTSYHVLVLSFDAGSEIGPSDTYTLFIDTYTRRIGGVRYDVPRPAYFPEGGTAPQRFMAFHGVEEVEGIRLAPTIRVHAWGPAGPGDVLAEITLSDITFRRDLDEDAFHVPALAPVVDATGAR